MSWYLAVLQNYAGFTGRARRQEYWTYILFNFIIGAALEILSIATTSSFFIIILAIYGLATLVPSLAVIVRRLHDTDRSGVWIFIGLVPFVGGIILLVFLCFEGTQGQNMFGPDPKQPTLAGGGYPPQGPAQGGYPQQGYPQQGNQPQNYQG